MKITKSIGKVANPSLSCIALLFLTACDAHRGHSNVRNKYPDAEVVGIPGHKYEWIVRTTNGEVWYVENTGVNQPQEGMESKLLKAPK